MKTFDYTVVVWKEKEGCVSKCPELGVASCGDSISEAVENLKEAVDLYLENAEGNLIGNPGAGRTYKGRIYSATKGLKGRSIAHQ